MTLVTRAGCHLCEEAEGDRCARLAGELGFGYAELDVDAEPATARASTPTGCR